MLIFSSFLFIIACLLLGHIFVSITLRRFLNKHQKGFININSSWQEDFLFSLSQLRHNLTHNAESTHLFCFIFIGLFMSLFWGWAPAVICIFIGHLFISKTLCALTNLDDHRAGDDATTFFLNPDENTASTFRNKQLYTWLLLYSFCALLFTVAGIISANILSLNSGAIFIIIALVMASYWFVCATSKMAKIAIPAVCLLLGIMLANHIGFYLIGHWQPFRQFDSLKVDDSWFFAISLVTIMYWFRSTMLRQSTNKREHSLTIDAYNKINSISHFLNLAVILAIFVFIIIKRPVIDTPMHAATENLPSYMMLIAIVLFFSAGNLFSLIARLFPTPTKKVTDIQSLNILHTRLNIQQPPKFSENTSSINLILSISALVILYLFTSSTGIGAWQSHFNTWVIDKPIVELLQTLTESIATAISIFGISEVTASTFIYSVFLLNLLLFMTKLIRLNEKTMTVLYSLTNANTSSTKHSEIHSRRINVIILLGLSILLLIIGTSINVWLILGLVSTSGVLIFMFNALYSILNVYRNGHAFIWLGVGCVCLIFALSVLLTLHWLQTNLPLGIVSSAITAITLFSQKNKVIAIFRIIRSGDDIDSFILDDENEDST